MKRATCYLILAMLLLLGGCQPKTEMSYNPYVEAFTTGIISRFAHFTLRAAYAYPDGRPLARQPAELGSGFPAPPRRSGRMEI